MLVSASPAYRQAGVLSEGEILKSLDPELDSGQGSG
jgi:hypothetical protein